MQMMGPFPIEEGLLSRRLGFNEELRSLYIDAAKSLPRPRLVAGLVVKNEEKNMPRVLSFLTKVADAVVIVDNGSTDSTVDICNSYDVVACVEHHPEEFHEGAFRNRVLELSRAAGAEWILGLDADEVFEESFEEESHALLRPVDRAIIAYGSNIVNFWRGEEQYRLDGDWGPNLKIRLFRDKPGYVCDMRRFHVGMNPVNLHWKHVRITSVRLLHYGYSDFAEAVRKQAFYASQDKGSQYGDYSHVTDETHQELARYVPGGDVGSVQSGVSGRFLRECFLAGIWLARRDRSDQTRVIEAFEEKCPLPSVKRSLKAGCSLGRLRPWG